MHNTPHSSLHIAVTCVQLSLSVIQISKYCNKFDTEESRCLRYRGQLRWWAVFERRHLLRRCPKRHIHLHLFPEKHRHQLRKWSALLSLICMSHQLIGVIAIQLACGHVADDNDTIRYDTRCYCNVRSKADISRLNLPHGNNS